MKAIKMPIKRRTDIIRIMKLLVAVMMICVASHCARFAEKAASPQQMNDYFGKHLFSDSQEKSLHRLMECYRQADQAGATEIIRGDKFRIRDIQNRLLQHALYLRYTGNVDSARFEMEVASFIARIYSQVLHDNFLSQQCKFFSELTDEQTEQKLLAEYYYAMGQQLLAVAVQDSIINLAQKNYKRSLKICNTIGDTRLAADNLVKFQFFSYKDGDYKKSLELGREILALVQKIGYRYREAWALFGIGTIQLNLGDYRGARKNLKTAQKIAADLDDRYGIMCVNERLCVANRRMGDFEAAFQANEQSAQQCQTFRDQRMQVMNLIDRGLIYQNMGDYYQALSQFEKAFEVAHKNQDFNESTALGNLGETYRIMGDFEKALKYDSLALKLDQRGKNYYLIARSQKYIGNVFRDKREVDRALQWYRQALETVNRGKKGLQPRRLASEIYHNIGDIHRSRNQWDLALQAYQQALATFEAIEVPQGIANSLISIGHVYREQQRYEKALKNFDRAFSIAKNIKHARLLWNAYYGSALVYQARQNYRAAENALRNAIQIVEQQRQRIYRDEDKINYFASHQDLYDNIFRVYYAQAKYDSAFIFSERSRARAFYDLFQGAPETFIKDYSLINEQSEIDIFISPVTISPSLAEIQQMLDEELTLVEYKLTAEKLFIIVVDQQRLQIRETDISKEELYDRVLKFRSSIGATDYWNFRRRIAIEPGKNLSGGDRAVAKIIPGYFCTDSGVDRSRQDIVHRTG